MPKHPGPSVGNNGKGAERFAATADVKFFTSVPQGHAKVTHYRRAYFGDQRSDAEKIAGRIVEYGTAVEAANWSIL